MTLLSADKRVHPTPNKTNLESSLCLPLPKWWALVREEVNESLLPRIKVEVP